MTQLQRLVFAPHQQSGQQIRLTADQQHYLGRVLRLQSGDRFIAMDGQGQWWDACLTSDPTIAEILSPLVVQNELPIAVNLFMALPKTGMDDIVRQSTELGVARIVPITSQRTLLRPSAQKLERWQRIAQEAAEQSERQIVPELVDPLSWANALQAWNANNSYCFICVARGQSLHLLTALQSVFSSGLGGLPITVAIGPEGGWTEVEVEQAIAVGYQPVSLGARILRATTAPSVALSLIASVFEVMPEAGKLV